MRRYKNKRILAAALAVLILILAVYLILPASKTTEPSRSVHSENNSAADIKTSGPAGFDKSKYPIDAASSLWAVVNKGRALPGDYVPPDLRAPNVPLRLSASNPEMTVRDVAATAIEKMFAAASKDGIRLRLSSGYRSYDLQVAVYNNYVKVAGVAQADTFSARPGHSEHQTGLAADLESYTDNGCDLDQCFGGTPEGSWLAANSYKFGFIIRYPKGKDKLTGYEYEPWHVRYVGDELAAQIHQSGQTLEQFFGLPVYDSYPSNGLMLKE